MVTYPWCSVGDDNLTLLRIMNEWVRIGPSGIVGAVAGQDNGLIANKYIPKGTVITNYKIGATMLNDAQLEARYPPPHKPTHVWGEKKGVYWDASTPPTLASSAMRGTSQTNNAEIMARSGNVRTTKPVQKDQEIFLPYGGTFRILKDPAPGPSILSLARAQHVGTLYDERGRLRRNVWGFDLNLSDEEPSDDPSDGDDD